MDTRLDISLSQIVNDFSLHYLGKEDHLITGIGSKIRTGDNYLTWAKNVKLLDKIQNGVVVCNETDLKEVTTKQNVSYIITDKSPRLIFTKILLRYLDHHSEQDFKNNVNLFRNRKDIKIGENVFIGENVKIGAGTIIHHNVVIHSNTEIGTFCTVMSNSSIGTEGLGLEWDPEKELYLKFPQIGGVIIEDHVEIGPNSTVRRSALDHTKIGKGTKIGSLCNVGHNCIVGQNCIMTSNVIIAGSSKIGDNVFVGIGATVKNSKNIADNATIGQGAVIVSHVPTGETWVGNPAKNLLS